MKTIDLKQWGRSQPVGLAIGLSLLSFLLLMLGYIVFLAYFQLAKMEQVMERALPRASQIAVDTRRLLQTLTEEVQPDCRPDNLGKVREAIFASVYQGDAGVLDERGQLVCTGLLGILPQAIPDKVWRAGRSSAKGVTLELLMDVPVPLGDGRYRATLVRQGRFITMIKQSAMQTLLGQGEDVVRILLPGDQSFLMYVSPVISPAQQELLGQPRVFQTDMMRYSREDAAFIVSRRAENSDVVVQIYLPLASFLALYRWHFFLVVLLALGVGGLVFGTLRPLFGSWRKMEHRIADLLRPENLLCMYQPIVDLQTGKPFGCEVLMRLRDGDLVLNPDQVIPAIMQRGLTWELDSMVVRKAMAELATVQGGIEDFKISFNFFPQNIQQGRVSPLLQGARQCWDIPGVVFEIEVLELEYQNILLEKITALRSEGFLISIDDFGTGYSNLGSIRAVEPDFLKIDKSFVFEMESSSVRSSLIPAIVGIARAVNARTIAEGVENESQYQLLRAVGVDYGQGFYFGRPEPLSVFVAYLAAHGVVAQPQTTP